MRALETDLSAVRERGLRCDVVPGVSAIGAGAAALQREMLIVCGLDELSETVRDTALGVLALVLVEPSAEARPAAVGR